MKIKEIQQIKESFENGWDKGVITGRRSAIQEEIKFLENTFGTEFCEDERFDMLIKKRLSKLKKELEKNG